MSHDFTISDLRQCPELFDTVADRIWQEWWQPNGYPLEYISTRLRENMEATPIPFALVARDGEKFLGTSSVIASDLAERPQFTPWVAAVWVEEECAALAALDFEVEIVRPDTLCTAWAIERHGLLADEWLYVCRRR